MTKERRTGDVKDPKHKRINGPLSKSVKRMTENRWKEVLRQVANGVKRAEVLKAVGITRQTLDAHLIESKPAAAQLKAAEISWLRRSWPDEKIEDVFTELAMGYTMKQAAERCFIDEADIPALQRLILKDEELRASYDDARKMQCEAWADETIEIADNGENDTYIKKGRNGEEFEATNHDVIARSRERIQARHWIMARLHHTRFGDRMKQDIEQKVEVNHAERLTKARQRREKAGAQRDGIAAAVNTPTQSPSTQH